MKLCLDCQKVQIPNNHKRCANCKIETNKAKCLARYHAKNDGKVKKLLIPKRVDPDANFTPEHMEALVEFYAMQNRIAERKRRNAAKN